MITSIEFCDLYQAAKSATMPVDLPTGHACLFKGLKSYLTGDYEEALASLLAVYEQQHVLPEPMIGLMAEVAQRIGKEAELAWPVLTFAEDAVAQAQWDKAMAAIKQIHSFCCRMEMVESPDAVKRMSRMLDIIAAHIPRPQSLDKPVPPKRKPRLAMVTVNLVDDVQAYAKTAMQFAKFLPRERFDCYLYFTEATWKERPQPFTIQFKTEHSIQRAPVFCSRLKGMVERGDTVVKFCPSHSFTRSAMWLAQELVNDQIDGVCFQGGVNAPIMWVASRTLSLPAKTALCLGVNMYQPELDATIYMNKINLDREALFWEPAWGKQLFISGGADIDAAQEAPRPDRSKFGIAPDQVTFGTMSNYIDARVTEAYMACVIQVLKACPEAVFIVMGQGNPDRARKQAEAAGVEDRCRWLPMQNAPFIALKLLDFYFNEFPVGGSQSIRECIACGIPATAMRCSDKHHESVGADIVGDACSIPHFDPSAYVQRAIEWVKSADLRQRIAQEQLERARNYYSAQGFIEQLAETMVEIASSKPV